MKIIKSIISPLIGAGVGAILILFGFSIGRTLILSIVIAFLPFIWFRHMEWKMKRGIEDNLANFLRDLSESIRAGVPLYKGITTAAKGEYGTLTPYIKQMRWQIEAGVSFEEALKRFSHQVGTDRVKRTVSLILRASEAGGGIADVLETASTRVRKHMEHTEKRGSNTKAYVAIAYVAYFVFIAIVYVLSSVFIPAMEEAAGGKVAQMIPTFEVEALRNTFFYLGILEAVATGAFAGKVGEGRVIAGIKHVIFLMVITYIVFFII